MEVGPTKTAFQTAEWNLTRGLVTANTMREGAHAMNLEIATLNGRLDEAFRQYVEQRVRGGLRRFEPRIVRATVSFLDLSGPFGAEQRCRLALSLAPGGEISVERRAASGRLALGRAVETATRELRRRFDAMEKPGKDVAQEPSLLRRE
ncbi:MAG: HPF/RaiA family ribosome-associated protein [Phycisphaerae bacterium]